MAKEKTIALGSGIIYIADYDGEPLDTTAPNTLYTKYFVDANVWGDTKNGATLGYSPSFKNVFGDLRFVDYNILQDETVTLSCGTVTFNKKILQTLIETARDATGDAEGMQTIKVGGINQATGKQYIIGFYHKGDSIQDAVRILMVGKNTGEFSFTFDPENETILNPTFTAGVMDEEGTKFLYTIGESTGD